MLSPIKTRTCISSVPDSLDTADVRHHADDVARLVTGQTLDFASDGKNQSRTSVRLLFKLNKRKLCLLYRGEKSVLILRTEFNFGSTVRRESSFIKRVRVRPRLLPAQLKCLP